MSVYPVGASGASCAATGCVCWSRTRRYPSDLSDAEWAILEPLAREQMAVVMRGPGRPMNHDLRAMLDAIGYVVRYGIEWRAMPADFPPWQAVYAFFQRWNQRELPERLAHRLRDRLRAAQDRLVQPTLALIDSQTVKAAEWIGAATRGFDGNKKINGRKRHLAVDVNGFLLAVAVTAANINDRTGAKLLLIALLNVCTGLEYIWADTGYDGWPLRQFFWNVANIVLKATPRGGDRSFKVAPRRWVIERTFAWLLRYRRLVRDYERRPEHHEAMIWWAAVMFMTRRAARHDQPVPRWTPRPTKTLEPTPT
jgi:transposase